MTDQSQQTQNKVLKVKDLTPNAKHFTLFAEICKVISRPSQDKLECRLVDETGIVSASFHKYGKYMNEGSVFKIINLKCRVHEHHLRVEMGQDSIVEKEPIKFGFKDKTVDMSEKFYSIKEEEKKMNEKNGKNLQNELRVNQKSKNITISEKPKIQQKREKKSNSVYHKKEQKPIKFEKEDIKQKKIIYVQKQISKNQSKITKQDRILIKQIPKNIEKYINLKALICKNSLAQFKDYKTFKIADETGSVQCEFFLNSKVYENEWYWLQNFKIYLDKSYGVVAVEQKKSRYRVADGGKVDYRPIKL